MKLRKKNLKLIKIKQTWIKKRKDEINRKQTW
jgi:hypothetical protein